MGSLIRDQQDASGLLYRRNRYYDPGTGRFTQEDPIGLAGGLNLYGYASGDPVNFSDPFGLCPMCVAIPVVVGGGELTAGGAALLAGGAAATALVVAKYDEIAGAISSELDKAGAQVQMLFARGGRLRSDPDAVGPHSTFKRNPQTGQVDKYDEFQPNSRNPNGFDRTKSFQRRGPPHTNKKTGEDIPTPHVNDSKTPGGVRRPEPSEIPPE